MILAICILGIMWVDTWPESNAKLVALGFFVVWLIGHVCCVIEKDIREGRIL